MGPFMVTRGMSSTNSACLATPFKIKELTIQSHQLAHISSLYWKWVRANSIRKTRLIFAGGGEELDWTLSCLFDAMGAMSSKYNDKPEIASRAYDKDRDGFVISGGAGVLVLECYEHAKARVQIFMQK